MLVAISRAIMRLDGFISADAPYEGGQLATPSIRFEGSGLELNLDTAGRCWSSYWAMTWSRSKDSPGRTLPQ